MQEEQQRRVHIMKQVPGLMALSPERKADLSGPAEKRRRQKMHHGSNVSSRLLIKLNRCFDFPITKLNYLYCNNKQGIQLFILEWGHKQRGSDSVSRANYRETTLAKSRATFSW